MTSTVPTRKCWKHFFPTRRGKIRPGASEINSTMSVSPIRRFPLRKVNLERILSKRSRWHHLKLLLWAISRLISALNGCKIAKFFTASTPNSKGTSGKRICYPCFKSNRIIGSEVFSEDTRTPPISVSFHQQKFIPYCYQRGIPNIEVIQRPPRSTLWNKRRRNSRSKNAHNSLAALASRKAKNISPPFRGVAMIAKKNSRLLE